MGESGLTAAELRVLEGALRQRRAEDVEESQHLAESLGDVLVARADAQADDEHDPEGPTLSYEWQRLKALQNEALDDVRAVDAALRRFADDTYGVCARCDRPIGFDRLEARPTATLCIDCARMATR